MQTFLPSPFFDQSARLLDNKRLGKQRVECLQILKSLTIPTYGWKNHPAVKMWRGYEGALCVYAREICREWKHRGFVDTCMDKITTIEVQNGLEWVYPPWLQQAHVDFIQSRTGLHISHQSNLIRKDPKHYGPLFPGVPDNLPYIWPVKE